MEPGDALSTAAQIAVALAGFAGVVVPFRPVQGYASSSSSWWCSGSCKWRISWRPGPSWSKTSTPG